MFCVFIKDNVKVYICSKVYVVVTHKIPDLINCSKKLQNIRHTTII